MPTAASVPPLPTNVLGVYERSLNHARELWPDERRRRFLYKVISGVPISYDAAVLPGSRQDRGDDSIELLVTAVPNPNTGDTLLLSEAPGMQRPTPAGQWRFVGYDVCDDAGTSVVSNCKVFDASAKVVWDSKLNDHHLFVGITDAIEFASLIESNVPEHGPLTMLGLYLRP